MGFLERLENLIQGAVEGSASSVLRQKIKPIDIENQLERKMREKVEPSRGGRLAPNNFTVWLHPDTFRETIAGVEGYNRHCELLLNQYASQQGYSLLHPRISVVFDTDADLGRRDVHVDADFDAPAPTPHVPDHTAPAADYSRTQVIQPPLSQPVQESQPESQRESQWTLQVVHGNDVIQQYTIPLGEVSVGRALDCDIVLQDERNTVSRQHAVIINHGHELRLRDSQSKNGTKVNGNYIPYQVETLITNGTEITFGACVVRVYMNRGQGGW